MSGTLLIVIIAAGVALGYWKYSNISARADDMELGQMRYVTSMESRQPRRHKKYLSSFDENEEDPKTKQPIKGKKKPKLPSPTPSDDDGEAKPTKSKKSTRKSKN